MKKFYKAISLSFCFAYDKILGKISISLQIDEMQDSKKKIQLIEDCFYFGIRIGQETWLTSIHRKEWGKQIPNFF